MIRRAWLILATMADLLGAVQAASIDLAHAGGAHVAPIRTAAQDLIVLLDLVKEATDEAASSGAAAARASAEASQAVVTAIAEYRSALRIEKATAARDFEAAVLRNRMSLRNAAIVVIAALAVAFGSGGAIGYHEGWNAGDVFGTRGAVVRDAQALMLRRVRNEAVRRHRPDIANFISSQIGALR